MPLQRENWSMVVSQSAANVERLASAALDNHATRKEETNSYQFKSLKTWAGSPGGDARPRGFCHWDVSNANSEPIIARWKNGAPQRAQRTRMAIMTAAA